MEKKTKSKKSKPSIMYSLGYDGIWRRRVWKEQCPESTLLGNHCQGVKGHVGQHWSYGPDGSYLYRNNKQDKNAKSIGISGSIPPGNKDYINPINKVKDYYMCHYVDSIVTDQKEIQRLYDGKIRENESLNMPVDFDRPKKLKKIKHD